MIRAAVDKAGSPEKLAAKLDVTPSYIRHIMRGKKPGPKLCAHIGVVEIKNVWRAIK
jgi:Helix-turn-helix